MIYEYTGADAAHEGPTFDPRADADLGDRWQDDDIDLSGGGAVWCPMHDEWEARAVMCP